MVFCFQVSELECSKQPRIEVSNPPELTQIPCFSAAVAGPQESRVMQGAFPFLTIFVQPQPDNYSVANQKQTILNLSSAPHLHTWGCVKTLSPGPPCNSLTTQVGQPVGILAMTHCHMIWATECTKHLDSARSTWTAILLHPNRILGPERWGLGERPFDG